MRNNQRFQQQQKSKKTAKHYLIYVRNVILQIAVFLINLLDFVLYYAIACIRLLNQLRIRILLFVHSITTLYDNNHNNHVHTMNDQTNDMNDSSSRNNKWSDMNCYPYVLNKVLSSPSFASSPPPILSSSSSSSTTAPNSSSSIISDLQGIFNDRLLYSDIYVDSMTKTPPHHHNHHHNQQEKSTVILSQSSLLSSHSSSNGSSQSQSPPPTQLKALKPLTMNHRTIETLDQLFDACVERFSHRLCLGVRSSHSPQYHYYTYGQINQQLQCLIQSIQRHVIIPSSSSSSPSSSPSSSTHYHPYPHQYQHYQMPSASSSPLSSSSLFTSPMSSSPSSSSFTSNASSPQLLFGMFEETRLESLLFLQMCFHCNIPVVTVYANLGDEALISAIHETKVSLILINEQQLSKYEQLILNRSCHSIRTIILIRQQESQSSSTTMYSHSDSDYDNDDHQMTNGTSSGSGGQQRQMSDMIHSLNNHQISVYYYDQLILEQQQQQLHATSIVRSKPHDTALIMYTSGTVDVPRGVMLSHENLLTSVLSVDIGLYAHDPSHIHHHLHSLLKNHHGGDYDVDHDVDDVDDDSSSSSHSSSNTSSRSSHTNSSVDEDEGNQSVYCAFLPLSHILEVVAEHVILYRGGRIGYSSPKTLLPRTISLNHPHHQLYSTTAGNGKNNTNTTITTTTTIGDLQLIRPTLLIAVPRVYEGIRRNILDHIQQHRNQLFQLLFHHAYQSKRRALLLQHRDTPLWNFLIFNRLKNDAKMASHSIRLFLSGGAPLSKETQEFMRICFSCPVLQGYGLTETSASCMVQNVYHPFQSQSVGCPMAGAQIRLVPVPDMNYHVSATPLQSSSLSHSSGGIAHYLYSSHSQSKGFYRFRRFPIGNRGHHHHQSQYDTAGRDSNFDYDPHHGSSSCGEIQVKGPTLFQGYFQRPDQTEQAFTWDGWFCTGDIGQLNSNGTFSIIDRKKNLVKLSHGEYIALERLENIYAHSPFVSPQGICVYGDSYRDYPVAIILPQRTYLIAWAQQNNIDFNHIEELCTNKRVLKAVLEDLRLCGQRAGLKRFEIVRNVRLLMDEWTVDNGLLTGTMKMKRNVLVKHYKTHIDAMYGRVPNSNMQPSRSLPSSSPSSLARKMGCHHQ